MVEYSLFDKIKMVYNLVISSPLFLILLFGIILMIIDMVYISKKDKKTKIIYGIISFLVIGIFMYSYAHSVLSIFDTIAKNIVAMIYFPTVLQYMITLLLSLIILFYSMLSSKMKSLLKRINTFFFIINAFLFFLILDQITSSHVDLSNKISIYTNSNLMMLFELSIFIFIAWIIGLTLYKIVKLLLPKEKSGESVNLTTNMNFYDEPELPKKLSDLRNPALIPEPKVEYVILEKKNENDMFTLAEYKQMRILLETIKKNQ